MYQESVKVEYASGAPHFEFLMLIAELSREHTKYFIYSIKHTTRENHCTLTALNPGVLESIVAMVKAAEGRGILKITSPKSLASRT